MSSVDRFLYVSVSIIWVLSNFLFPSKVDARVDALKPITGDSVVSFYNSSNLYGMHNSNERIFFSDPLKQVAFNPSFLANGVPSTIDVHSSGSNYSGKNIYTPAIYVNKSSYIGNVGLNSGHNKVQKIASKIEQFTPKSGAFLRLLDKVSYVSKESLINVGDFLDFQDIRVILYQCISYNDFAYHKEDYALVQVFQKDPMGEDTSIFYGWLFSKQRSLSYMDHPEYDVWLAKCSDDDLSAYDQPPPSIYDEKLEE